ncbi:putative transcription factor NAM family [Medicago truncatula]|uniref:Putative transcription factor NAM family n=1 Tax=Medicago truncatula TaxID=3880 RepID=A0A396GJ50_MEDTR|nr:putative transcription factor NAM family [Medicago truncatula]
MKKAEIKGEEENDTMMCDEGEPSRQMTPSFPPILHYVGFRFCPTGEELVNHYLRNKLLGNDAIVNNVIAEVDIRKFEPWELPGKYIKQTNKSPIIILAQKCDFYYCFCCFSARSVIKSDDQEWFFLCPIEYKYAKSKRFKRTTNNGFWKATGMDRNIRIRGTNEVIGIKKTLVYHENHVPGVKTNWIIHEYHDVTLEDSQDLIYFLSDRLF